MYLSAPVWELCFLVPISECPLGLTRWKVKLWFPAAWFTCLMKVFFFVWCRAVSAEKLANQKSHSVERKLKQRLRVWWRPMKNMGGWPRLSLTADVSNLHLTKMLNKSTVTSPQCCTPPILFYFSFSYIPWMSRRHLSYLWTDVFTEGEGKKKMLCRIIFQDWRMVIIEVTWADAEIASFAPIQPTLSSASFHDSSTKQQYWKVYPLLLSSFKCKWNS